MKQRSFQEELDRAQADYERFRAAYLQVCDKEPGHEVALAMIGSDMDRAYSRLQALSNLPQQSYSLAPSAVLRRHVENAVTQ